MHNSNFKFFLVSSYFWLKSSISSILVFSLLLKILVFWLPLKKKSLLLKDLILYKIFSTLCLYVKCTNDCSDFSIISISLSWFVIEQQLVILILTVSIVWLITWYDFSESQIKLSTTR